MITEKEVREALKEVIDPEVGTDIVTMNLIKDIRIEKDTVEIDMTLTVPADMCPLAGLLKEQVKSRVEDLPGVSQVKVNLVDRK